MRIALCLLVIGVLAAPTLADDYPQWFGPQRDGIYRERGILSAFPKEGAKILWRARVAAGDSQPVVARDRVIVTDHVLGAGVTTPSDPFKTGKLPGVERVLCFYDAGGPFHWKGQCQRPYTL